MAREQAQGLKQVENDRVIVTEWRFSPGAETGWHKHAHDYVVVPSLDGELLIEDADGEKRVALHAGMQVPLSFLVAATIALVTALSFSELASRIPVSAGEPRYVDEAFHLNWLSTFIGWAVISGRFLSPTNTWRALRFSRVPSQSGQACVDSSFANSSRTAVDSVSR